MIKHTFTLLSLLTASALPLSAGISAGPSLPTVALISNPTGSSGSSTINSTTIKGNSFVLDSAQTISSVTFMVSGVTDVTGTITLDFYNLSGTPDSTTSNGPIPTGAALMTQDEMLPSSPSIVGGDYVTITLTTPLNLTAGNYAFAISTADTNFNAQLNKDNTYTQGELMKNKGSWDDRANDLVFAIGATGGIIPDLSNPSTWPNTLVEVAPQITAQTTQVSTGNLVNQTFVLSSSADVDSVLMQLDDTSASADLDGALKVEIFNDDGAGQPTGAALLSHTGSIPSGVGASAFLQFNFSSAAALTAGNYVFTISTSDTDVLLNATASDLIYGITGTNNARPLPSSGPNILFILVDDWGWTDHSSSIMASDGGSSYPSDFYQTPNFERLVNQGVALTSTYAQPNCAPTRAALLSGQYSPRRGNGVYNVSSLNRSGKRTTYTTPTTQGDEHANGDEQTITVAEAFYNSGYVTAHFGKYHAGSSTPSDPTHPLNQGFDFNYGGSNAGNPGDYFAKDTTPRTFGSKMGPELDPFAADYTTAYITSHLTPYINGNTPSTLVGTKKHLTDAMADAFISFRNDHNASAMSAYPFYAQLHFYAVHGPVRPRPDLEAKYEGLPGGANHNNTRYAALIEGMDHSLGRVLDYLDDPNGDGNTADSISENTLVIFCSDNGGTGETNVPLRNIKGTHFQGGIRVPAVIRMPGTVPAGKVSDTLTHVVDFYPTMLDFAGGIFPDTTTHPLDGVSLFNHLKDPDNVARDREPIFYHFPGYMDNRAYNCSMMIKEVDGKRYKYIYSYDPYYEPSESYDQYQLYNLTDDISETVNLLDYIDVENASDTSDPSTSEEYWNYLLYKNLGNEMAADMNSWLDHGTSNPNDPADATWSPIYSTYKSTYPGIAPELIGQETGPAPANIAEVETPIAQTFHITQSVKDIPAQEVTIEFVSTTGFTYDIERSNNLQNWVVVDSNIPGEANSTTRVVSDSSLPTNAKNFYRVVLRSSN